MGYIVAVMAGAFLVCAFVAFCAIAQADQLDQEEEIEEARLQHDDTVSCYDCPVSTSNSGTSFLCDAWSEQHDRCPTPETMPSALALAATAKEAAE